MQGKIAGVAIGALLAFSAQAADELKIGFLSTLSGPAGSIGIEIRDGFNLALKLAGGKLGGLPTEVIFADDALNPDTASSLPSGCLKRDRVNLMTGVVFSNVMLAIWPTIQEVEGVLRRANADADHHHRQGLQPVLLLRPWPNEAHHEAAGALRAIEGLQERLSDRAELSGGQGRAHRLQAHVQGQDRRRGVHQAEPARLLRGARADPRRQARRRSTSSCRAAWASTSSSSSSPPA